MNNSHMVTLSQVCQVYHFDMAIAMELADFGLFPLHTLDQEVQIEVRFLEDIRSIFSLHRDLGVNPEGIEVVQGLKARISDLQKEILYLKERSGRLDSLEKISIIIDQG